MLAGCVNIGPIDVDVDIGMGKPRWQRDCSISNWGDPCTAKGTLTTGPANELMLAVNPKDPDNVVIGSKNYDPAASDCVWAGTSVTHDGGKNWTNGWVGGDKAHREPRLAAYDCVTDPVLDFGADGTLYYLVEAYNIGDEASSQLPPPLGGFGAGSNMWLAASFDGGDSWELRGVISLGPGSALLLHDKSDLAASPRSGTLAASWTMFGAFGAQLVYTRSTDGGRTFAPPQRLMELGRVQEGAAMVDLDWDAEGRLHAVWFNWSTGEVMYAVSQDDGATFSEPRVLAQAHPWTGQNAPNSDFRIFDSPMLAVDTTEGPRAGRLYLTWADDQAAEDDHDVWLLRSEDGGATWSEPLHVGSTLGADQFHPNLVVASDGSVHLFFYDRRYAEGNRLLDATHGVSLDGGLSWNWTRASASSFDGDLGIHQGGFPFMGDYNGIGAGGDVAYLTYADTREGRSDVAVGKWVLR